MYSPLFPFLCVFICPPDEKENFENAFKAKTYKRMRLWAKTHYRGRKIFPSFSAKK